MGNKAAIIPFVVVACALAFAAFLFSPQPAAAASRISVARSIIDLVNQRLCERQEALGGRIRLISPDKCAQTPPPQQEEPTVTLTASPTSITAGQSTTLTWSSTNATSCSAFVGWTGSKATSGSQSVSPTVTTTYQLDCTGPGGVGSDDATVTVTVVNPTTPTVDISADPMTITAGSSTTLTWNSENATSCTAANGWSGSKILDGTQVVSPSVTTTYAISCTGAGGTANDSVTVTVNAAPDAPTLTFTADPTSITTMGTSTLTWASTNATSCTASGGWSGAKSLSGTQNVTPNATTTYSLNCIGAGGNVSKSVTVNVVPATPNQPTVDLVASRTSVTPGAGSATTTLSWTTTNATSCTASGGGFTGSKALNGSEIITPSATTTYMLECSGAGGSASDTVVVNFVPTQGEEEPDPTLSFNASRATVNEGSVSTATTTLTWDSTDATSCTASGATEWIGAKTVDGTLEVTPTADVTYEMDCTGTGGDVHQEVVIDFVPVAPASGALLITEVIYDLTTSTTSPQGAEPGNEWVELFNGTASTINLSGYFVHDASSTDALPNVNIPAGKYALITGSSTTATFWSIPGDAVVIVLPNTTIGDGLGNAGDMVWLENSASTTVDSVSWGTNTSGFTPPGSVPTFTANVGDSIGRINLTDTNVPGDWMRQVNPTPGGTNSN